MIESARRPKIGQKKFRYRSFLKNLTDLVVYGSRTGCCAGHLAACLLALLTIVKGLRTRVATVITTGIGAAWPAYVTAIGMQCRCPEEGSTAEDGQQKQHSFHVVLLEIS